MSKEIDLSRSVVFTGLPSALLEDAGEDFIETIYEMLESTFCLPRGVADHIIRYPSKKDNEECCKCLVSFRSRAHKHIVEKQRVRLEEPVTIEKITKLPSEMIDFGKDVLEMASDVQNGPFEDLIAQEKKADQGNTTAQGTFENENELLSDSAENFNGEDTEVIFPKDGATHDFEGVTTEMASGVRKEPRLTAGKNTSKTVTEKPAARIESKNKRLSKDSSEQSQTTPADEKGKTISESAKNVCILKESDPDGDGNMKDFDLKGQKEVEMKKSEKADDIVVTDDADLEPLTTLDIHKEHYQKLPISWDGAPNFNWKTVESDEDKVSLIISNFLQCDLYNPWLYPVTQCARRISMSFDDVSYMEIAKDTLGTLNLEFANEDTLIWCTLNNLVYLRTTRKRRLKIYLPQTDLMRKCGRELEKRLGRLRKPLPCMCELVIKSVLAETTSDDIRTIAFPDSDIGSVSFRNDRDKNRCAVVSFASARRAIMAHTASSYVQITKDEEKPRFATVVYPYVAIPDYINGNSLLVHSELDRKDVNKETPMDFKKKKSSSERAKATKDTEEVGKSDDAERESNLKRLLVRSSSEENEPHEKVVRTGQSTPVLSAVASSPPTGSNKPAVGNIFSKNKAAYRGLASEYSGANAQFPPKSKNWNDSRSSRIFFPYQRYNFNDRESFINWQGSSGAPHEWTEPYQGFWKQPNRTNLGTGFGTESHIFEQPSSVTQEQFSGLKDRNKYTLLGDALSFPNSSSMPGGMKQLDYSVAAGYVGSFADRYEQGDVPSIGFYGGGKPYSYNWGGPLDRYQTNETFGAFR